ncbi:bifunctional adenosylcobinamide kinase/adenosylcobinamide-phosphate guanylyltransferase [Shewanella livingstonensis]|uniref:Bifunctional adenosylcobalamin biosynthesis protein n=1 Tax=Shewanella livingstonensis TaxID=150120 RepID=A0A3G8LUH2_9GAMM|nr:bifunctional adenosylcobinamide kinase/adenosylcobinamide-phosphate guanylyltransferase [Shewanella livingstonensis]AZG73296.1 bifunctional adenosylcobinamide kinase/adenosylcobinamide-phosphate guanylyltransferase [Shewanella livingstonensis]
MISLFIGGARSGKSGLAEAFITAQAQGEPIIYVATAEAAPSMQQRIALHQQRRPKEWAVIEEPYALVDVLLDNSDVNQWIIIDCLTLWLTNHLIAASDLKQQIARLIYGLQRTNANIVLVSTETGLGLIPDDEMSQQFVIASGELHQAVATCADNVIFCQANLANVLKGRDYFELTSNAAQAQLTLEALC